MDASEALDDLRLVEDYIEHHDLEFQVSFDYVGWHVRVRGHDPTGAYHETAYTVPCVTTAVPSLPSAMLEATREFCTVWGLA